MSREAARRATSEKATAYLNRLCVELDGRRVGSPGNRAATDWFARLVAGFGFETDTPRFDCMDWSQQGVSLTAGGNSFEAQVSPYSVGCTASAPLAVVSTIEELEALPLSDVAGKVLLLHGEIATEQLMPKNFVFYNPDEHKRIIQLVEDRDPATLIAATTSDPGLAGAVSPFPLIEDGDFDIASAFMTRDEGLRLASVAGETVDIEIRAERRPAVGCNVVATKGDTGRRVVLFAHIDAKDGTPGAIDNGTGVVILALLAELLADYDGELGIEIVALNGEDYYAASGEMLYLAANEGRFPEIKLGINMDGVGFREGKTAFSLYECEDELAGEIRGVFAGYSDLAEGEQWYQSDHGLFIMHQRPALALTSDHFTALWTEIAHTPKDTPDIVDPDKLVGVAHAVCDLLLKLADESSAACSS